MFHLEVSIENSLRHKKELYWLANSEFISEMLFEDRKNTIDEQNSKLLVKYYLRKIKELYWQANSETTVKMSSLNMDL